MTLTTYNGLRSARRLGRVSGPDGAALTMVVQSIQPNLQDHCRGLEACLENVYRRDHPGDLHWTKEVLIQAERELAKPIRRYRLQATYTASHSELQEARLVGGCSQCR